MGSHHHHHHHGGKPDRLTKQGKQDSHSHHHHLHGHVASVTSGIKLAIVLNLCFSVIEFAGAYFSNSTAILSDAFHDLGDTLVFVFAWVMQILAEKGSNRSFTYGFKRFSLLSSLVTAGILLVGSGFAIYLAASRLSEPVEPQTSLMMGFSVFGVVVNGLGAYLMQRGNTLSEKVLTWHFLEDVLGWVAIFLGAVFINWFDLPIIDPLLAIGLSAVILFGVARNLRQGAALFLQASPGDLPRDEIVAEISALPGVVGVHDLHLWSLDGQDHVMTLHVVVKATLDRDAVFAVRRQVYEVVGRRGRVHLTCDIEPEGDDCHFTSRPC